MLVVQAIRHSYFIFNKNVFREEQKYYVQTN